MENSEARKGCFTASRIFELLAGGTGATATSYIYDVAYDVVCKKKDFDTSAMKHGRVSQIEAYNKVIKPMYKNAVWFDEFLPINANCGASPDILIDKMPFDVKCPYFIDTYLEQINKVPTKYYQQIQMQMMATGGDMCGIGFYLTKPEIWGEDEWTEFPFALEDRTKIFEYPKDDNLHDLILTTVELAAPKRDVIIEKMLNATTMPEDEYFYLQFLGKKKFRKAKTGNVFNIDYIRVGDDFYYEPR